ncbi:NYN domain-containing protein [Mycolicibacterium elephantis]|uniref:NYN domain-containing protein n=1 Tax=Mycolicibacterium elephantis TaxID=81858 RepID=UPI0013E3D1EF|nr:NYN domain-containing protein [Mycolicibacterium elephantis]MCV7221879.1 hypothetical protein [Mycolicibacterium elephantis]
MDLENVVGSGHVTELSARQARAGYLASGLVAPGDLVVVGVSHHNVLAAGFGWADARRVARSGSDGADLALQEVMATENLFQRFSSAIIVTGDGGFASPVARLIGRGLTVGVVAPRGRLSAALKLAASVSCEIDFSRSIHTPWSA